MVLIGALELQALGADHTSVWEPSGKVGNVLKQAEGAKEAI